MGKRLSKRGRTWASATALALLLGAAEPEQLERVSRELNSADAHVRAQAIAEAERLMEDESAGTREVALRMLSRARSLASQERMTRALSDAVPEVRIAAIDALVALNAQDRTAAIADRVQDAEVRVRLAAVIALGALRATDADAWLARASADTNAEVRATALGVIARLHRDMLVSAVRARLTDEQPDVRIAAVEALGTMRAPDASADLVALLNTAQSRVEQAAVHELSQIGDARAVDGLFDALATAGTYRLATTALTQLTPHDEAAARAFSARMRQCLQEMNVSLTAAVATIVVAKVDDDFSSLSRLLADARRSSHGTDQTLVTRAWARAAGESALMPLLVDLRNTDASARTAAISGLEELASLRLVDGRAVEPLLERFDASVDVERRRVAVLLVATGSTRALDAVATRALGDDQAMRSAILGALAEHGHAMPLRALEPLLVDADAQIRANAFTVLGHGEPIATSRWILGALARPSPIDRAALLRTLQALVPHVRENSEISASIRSLSAKLLDFGQASHRVAGARLLATLGDEASVALILLAEAQFDDATRAHTLLTLESSAPSARHLVAHGLAHHDANVRAAALLAAPNVLDDAHVQQAIARAADASWVESVAATFILAHADVTWMSQTMQEKTCSMAKRKDPWIRANALRALARVGQQCGLDDDTLARWERTAHNAAVRSNARALRLTREGHAAQTSAATSNARFHVLDAQHQVAGGMLVSLLFSDDTALVLPTDGNGDLVLRRVPSSEARINDALASSLENE